ncbi:GDSL-type esterase/lipase family protein [Corallibacter sp.]|uniref:SGNH/GDSL hydrolase family protein n=1 Tax=Corallibacter sp. TaxID=2038084 RepID=UPI003A91368F
MITKYLKLSLYCLTLVMIMSCKKDKELLLFNPNNPSFNYSGRVFINSNAVSLIGSASSVVFKVKGNFVNLLLQSEFKPRNYVALVINGKYQKRYTITGDSINKINLKLPENENNTIEIYKATEAASGEVLFHGVEAFDIASVTNSNTYSIEFIGDSITCGALSDNSGIDCNQGEYIDQHNAYLAYGPRLSRLLNANFVLSSVSGIGMYRNWNDENIEQPIMPQVYDNLSLNEDDSKPYNINFQPDVVSICLGTNDMSQGDGVKERLPFNSEKYTSNYIEFVKTIYKRYPNTKVAILNSPMIQGEGNDTLVKCLNKVKSYFKINAEKDIEIFQFDKVYPNGCNYHPSVDEHKEMAEKLKPFFNKLLKK